MRYRKPSFDLFIFSKRALIKFYAVVFLLKDGYEFQEHERYPSRVIGRETVYVLTVHKVPKKETRYKYAQVLTQ